jgi:hypothetical protein
MTAVGTLRRWLFVSSQGIPDVSPNHHGPWRSMRAAKSWPNVLSEKNHQDAMIEGPAPPRGGDSGPDHQEP